jgi:hypothetical protein
MGLRGIWARSLGVTEQAGSKLAAGTPTLSRLTLRRQLAAARTRLAFAKMNAAICAIDHRRADPDVRFTVKADVQRFECVIAQFT